ncbi:DUF6207 family protein [Streptomyces sp. NPDC056309]|uniref:DUF6207 family protein n=1 Tax=unclassified Streptomyces TaxID=2593676 RepID=UPI0035DDF582
MYRTPGRRPGEASPTRWVKPAGSKNLRGCLRVVPGMRRIIDAHVAVPGLAVVEVAAADDETAFTVQELLAARCAVAPAERTTREPDEPGVRLRFSSRPTHGVPGAKRPAVRCHRHPLRRAGQGGFRVSPGSRLLSHGGQLLESRRPMPGTPPQGRRCWIRRSPTGER